MVYVAACSSWVSQDVPNGQVQGHARSVGQQDHREHSLLHPYIVVAVVGLVCLFHVLLLVLVLLRYRSSLRIVVAATALAAFCSRDVVTYVSSSCNPCCHRPDRLQIIYTRYHDLSLSREIDGIDP